MFSHDELCREKVAMNQKMREQQQVIAKLKAQLDSQRKRFADEKQLILDTHNAELKKKDAESVEKEISFFQRLSLVGLFCKKNIIDIVQNTPTSENKFNCASSDCDSTSKLPLNDSLNRSNSALRPQSLYIHTPNGRPFSSHDLVGKDRHRTALFTNSNNQLHLSRSSSTTPDR